MTWPAVDQHAQKSHSFHTIIAEAFLLVTRGLKSSVKHPCYSDKSTCSHSRNAKMIESTNVKSAVETKIHHENAP